MRKHVIFAAPLLAGLTLGCTETPTPQKAPEAAQSTAAAKPGVKSKRAPKPPTAGATKPAMQTAPID